MSALEPLSTAPPALSERRLAAAQFQGLARLPAEAEWFANIANIANPNTRRAYEKALKDFMAFVGIEGVQDFRVVTRAHILAWRQALELQGASGATIRHRLAALSSLYEWLCDANAVTHNPLKGVRRPSVESYEGKTPALGDHQVRALLEAPAIDTLKGRRDRAILATLLYHGLRREELCKLRVDDARHQLRGVVHLAVQGKGGKTRYLPLHPAAGVRITEYLEAAGHVSEGRGALFRPVYAGRAEGAQQALSPEPSTNWFGRIRHALAAKWAHTRCVRRPPQTRSPTRPTSPRCRSGWATRTSRRRSFTTGGRRGPRTARRLRFRTNRLLRVGFTRTSSNGD